MVGLTCIRRAAGLFGLALVAGGTISCGDVVTSSRAPVLIVIDSLQGIRGAVTVGTPTNPLISDVITNVTSPAPCTTDKPCPTIFADNGSASMRIVLKDIGTTAAPTQPSTNNAVTITRYHVTYVRADGRNTPGVDVPFGFDGGGTITLGTSASTFTFELVRATAKEEAPLVQLRTNPSILTFIAQVTFYGKDVVGNDVSATGTVQVEAGNWGDFGP